MAEPFLSEISMVSFQFAPRGYALCNGQLLPINTNQALFSLLGTAYGGDGLVNFALPDFRGRLPVGEGNGFTLGLKQGSAANTLTAANIPAHVHGVTATLTMQTGDAANTASPANAFPAPAVAGSPRFSNQADDKMAVVQANDLVSDPVNNGLVTDLNHNSATQPFNNMMPYLCVNFIIALQGVFPSTT
jgi:microcystin-dependent protein